MWQPAAGFARLKANRFNLLSVSASASRPQAPKDAGMKDKASPRQSRRPPPKASSKDKDNGKMESSKSESSKSDNNKKDDEGSKGSSPSCPRRLRRSLPLRKSRRAEAHLAEHRRFFIQADCKPTAKPTEKPSSGSSSGGSTTVKLTEKPAGDSKAYGETYCKAHSEADTSPTPCAYTGPHARPTPGTDAGTSSGGTVHHWGYISDGLFDSAGAAYDYAESNWDKLLPDGNYVNGYRI